MTTTITVEGSNININGFNLEELLLRVYRIGKDDGLKDAPATKVTFIQLRKELDEQGRHITPRKLLVRLKPQM